MLDQAIECAKSGYSVLALSPNSKIPIKDALLQKNGSKSASKDPKHITELFTTYPKANLGVATGEMSMITVIDIDSLEAKDFLKREGFAPKTRIHKTPRGWHVIVPYNPDLKQTANIDGMKIDVRSDGGYVVWPPSHISGKKYEVLVNREPTKEPELESFLIAKHTANGRQDSHRGASNNKNGVRYPDWVNKLLSEGASEGSRNDRCASLSGYFRSQGMNENQAYDMIKLFAERCSPVMSENEIETVIASIWKYEPTTGAYPYQNKSVTPPIVDVNIANRRVFRFPDSGLLVDVSRISETRRGIDCELTIQIDSYPIYGPVHADLMSNSSRTNIMRALKERREEDWGGVLQHVAYLVRKTLSGAGSFLDISKVDPLHADSHFLVNPVLRYGEPTLIYGHGGSGKSSLALALALSYATGKEIVPGFTPTKTGNVAVLDFETTEFEHRRIMGNLAKGMGIEIPEGKIFYWKVSPPLIDNLDTLVRMFQEHEIDWYILDSVVGAGLPNDPFKPESPMSWKVSQQVLGVACLGISHVSAENISSKNPRPYGSVYFWDWSRSCFYMEHQQEEGQSVSSLGLFQKKGNAGMCPPIFLDAYFNKAHSTITYEKGDPDESSELAKKRSISIRIISLLEDEGGEWLPARIAERLDEKQGTVRSALKRMVKKQDSDVYLSPSGIYTFSGGEIREESPEELIPSEKEMEVSDW